MIAFRPVLSLLASAFLGAALMSSHSAQAQTTLKAVQERGVVNCGVNDGLIGFADDGGKGQWAGFDVDFCRAIAAAVFGDPKKVTYIRASTDERFNLLKTGKVDLLSRNSTWTLGREAEQGLLFAGVTYFDGQGFLMPRNADVISALDLSNARICALTNTTSYDNAGQYLRAQNVPHELVPSQTPSAMLKTYLEGKCNVITSDVSQLHSLRMELPKPQEQMIIPDVISKEPLGPVVRNDDVQWFNIVKWVNYAMINAEELGVSSKMIDAAMSSRKGDVMRLVGTEGELGKSLGLQRDWAAKVIRYVGNYGEIFERNVGVQSRLGIPRGLNQLWTHGGILYAPPVR